jgi:peroxiredoxin
MRLSRRRALSFCALCGVIALAVLFIDPDARERLHDAAYAAGFRRPVPVVHPVQTGESLPALQLADLRGVPVAFPADRRGVVVYNVFASWCGPCNEEAGALGVAALDLRKRGVRFVGIDQGESAAQAQAYTERYALRYPVLLDSDQSTRSALGARVLPETLIVSGGIVKSILVGPVSEQDLIRSLEGA